MRLAASAGQEILELRAGQRELALADLTTLIEISSTISQFRDIASVAR
jgi:hypothetical protein